jgi:hypothetical protein
MKGKLTLATVAVAFTMLAMPATASAHFDRKVWSRVDCLFSWMHRDWCKLWTHRHYRHR